MILEAKALKRKPVNHSEIILTDLEKSDNKIENNFTELDSPISEIAEHPGISNIESDQNIKNDNNENNDKSNNNIFGELLNMSFSTAQGIHDAVSTELILYVPQ